MRKLLTLTAALVMLSATAAQAVDIFMAKMQSADGQVTVHQQTVAHENCLKLLDQFRQLQAEGEPFMLTLLDPTFTGIVLAPFCVERDGRIRGVDGYVNVKP